MMGVVVSLYSHLLGTSWSVLPFVAEHCDTVWFANNPGEECWVCGRFATVRTRSGTRVRWIDYAAADGLPTEGRWCSRCNEQVGHGVTADGRRPTFDGYFTICDVAYCEGCLRSTGDHLTHLFNS